AEHGQLLVSRRQAGVMLDADAEPQRIADIEPYRIPDIEPYRIPDEFAVAHRNCSVAQPVVVSESAAEPVTVGHQTAAPAPSRTTLCDDQFLSRVCSRRNVHGTRAIKAEIVPGSGPHGASRPSRESWVPKDQVVPSATRRQLSRAFASPWRACLSDGCAQISSLPRGSVAPDLRRLSPPGERPSR
ncbi:MAG: hypothetical protein M3290_01295, partial [Actinomycetota bacterium]|nr:hypothetical protein [Actinomycetota bacterium]